MGVAMEVGVFMGVITVGSLFQVMMIVVIMGMPMHPMGVVIMHLLVMGLDVGEGFLIRMKEGLDEPEPGYSIAFKGDHEDHSKQGPSKKGSWPRRKLDQVLRQKINKENGHHEAGCYRNEDLKAVHIHVAPGPTHDQHAKEDHQKRDQDRKKEEKHSRNPSEFDGFSQ